ncbi:hypothetical protein D3C79_558840 [compost metagenome]
MRQADGGNAGQAWLAAGMLEQFPQRLQQLLPGQRFAVMPTQLAAQEKLPAQAVLADLPVMSQIRLRLRVAGHKAGQSGVQSGDQMLLGAAGEGQRIQGFQRAVVGDTQRRAARLPLAAEVWAEQLLQMLRIQLRHFQCALMIAILQQSLQMSGPQFIRGFQAVKTSAFAAPGL